MSDPVASVIVCTRNRAGMLADCLETILADRSAVPREIVVVDNGSTDETAAVVRSFANRGPHPVRYVYEPRTGTSPARTAGVEAARGAFLLFADDDVEARDGWADGLVAGFENPEVVVVAGRIEAEWPFPPPSWLDGPQATLLTLLEFGPEPRLLGPADQPVAASLGFRAAAVRALPRPWFHPRLGHVGHVHIGHEETHLVNRLRAHGLVAYRPDSVVVLRVDPERIDLDWMRPAFFQLGIGMGRCSRLEGVPFPSPPRRAVRAARLLRAARRQRRTNEGRPRTGPETWDELSTYMWAGLHVEMLLGRFGRLSDWTVKAFA